MKQTCFLILILFLVASLFLANGFAQDYIHYATFAGHTDSVYSISFSPDGHILASGSADGTVRLWDVTTGKHLQTLAGHTDSVSSVSFSPNGQILASGSWDTTIRLWDVTTGKYLRALIGHTHMIDSVSFSPNGQTLASAGWDTTIRLWNVATSKQEKTLIGHRFGIHNMSFSPDGQTLASGSLDGAVHLWDIATSRHRETFTGVGVCFSPDGQTLATTAGILEGANPVNLWDVATGKHKKKLMGRMAGGHDVCFSPDGLTLAGGNCLWDIATGKVKKIPTDNRILAFSPDGQTFASGSLDGTVRLWRIPTSRPTYTNPSTPSKTSNQVYDNAIRSVMWMVNPDISEGSGALLDKKFRLAITNAHVTGIQNTIDVYFPAPDEKGEFIKDRNFYLTSKGVLKRLGYYTKGHVVARNEKTDLAIIRLDGLPETAREVDWDFTTPTTNAGDLVYILGNPGGQDLWRWTLGEFLNDHGDFLHIQSDVFGGNSGGPVLNKQGILIGIVARSDRHMNALAIPVRDLNRLLSESQLKHSRSSR